MTALSQQYETSPERVDITIFDIIDVPILKNGLAVGMQRLVDYAPQGAEDMVRMQVPIEDLLCIEQIDDPHSVQHNIAKARAAMVQRALSRKSHTDETPDGQIALEVWSGLTPVMCKTLRKVGIRSLQELASATEATTARMAGAIINPRKLVEQCRMYLSSMDKTMATAELQATREENEALKERMAQMEAKFAAVLERFATVEEETGEAPAKRKYTKRTADVAPTDEQQQDAA